MSAVRRVDERPRRGRWWRGASIALAGAAVLAVAPWLVWQLTSPQGPVEALLGKQVSVAGSVSAADAADRPQGGAAARPPTAGQTLPRWSTAQWLTGQAESTHPWRVAWWDENPQVLVIEFPSLAAQGLAMNRLAAYLQKAAAPRGRVLPDDELARLIATQGDSSATFFQGHDYREEDVQRFFEQVLRQRLQLGVEELRLQAQLVSAGLLPAAGAEEALAPAGGTGTSHTARADARPPALAPPRAVVSFTSLQRDDPATQHDETVDAVRREAILRHELSHGRYYTEPAYRAHCEVLWREMLTERQRQQLRRFLAQLGYDTANEDLVINEAQAFLLHTPDARAFAAAQAGMGEAELDAVRQQFWQSLPASAGPRGASVGR